MVVLYILIAIVAFGLMILVHELGHFMFAKKFGVAISEFSMGMGPKLFSKVGKDGVCYSLRLFPIGGYVAMIGEEEDSDNPNAFHRKKPWQRFIIILAGATMNLLVGFLVMTCLTVCTPRYGTTTIGKFAENSVSEQSGLKIGDEIIKIGKTRVHTANEMSYEVMRSGYQPISVTVLRDGNQITIDNVTFPTVSSQDAVFGAVDFAVYGEDRTFFTVVKNAFYDSKSTVKMIWDSLFDLIGGRYGIEAVSGPVGVTGAIADAAKTSAYNLFYLIAVISINLGIFNLLPIPALDGCALLFIIYEMIFKNPVPRKIEGATKTVGFFLLIILMVFVSVKDIFNLF